MIRSWMLLAVVPIAALLLTGATPVPTVSFVAIDDEDEKMTFDELMTEVNKANITIRRSYRSPITYKRDFDKIKAAAETLAKLGKVASKETKFAEKLKKDHKEWVEIMTSMIEGSEKVVEIMDNGGSNTDVRSAYANVTKSCSKCHSVFRVDDDF